MKVNFGRFLFICLLILFMIQYMVAQIVINNGLINAYEKVKTTTIEELRDFSELDPYMGTAFITYIKEDTLNSSEVIFPKIDRIVIPTYITEWDKKNQGLNSDVMYVFSKFSGDTLYCRMGFFFNTMVIEHKVFEGNVQMGYKESSGNFKMLKLNKTDTLASMIEIPVKATRFELSTSEYKPDETIYGFCEMETDPFFRLAEPGYKAIIKVKRRFKYYFSFKFRENKGK